MAFLFIHINPAISGLRSFFMDKITIKETIREAQHAQQIFGSLVIGGLPKMDQANDEVSHEPSNSRLFNTKPILVLFKLLVGSICQTTQTIESNHIVWFYLS